MASHSTASGVFPSSGESPRLTGRRVLFASLVFLTAAGLLALMAAALFLPAGIDAWGIAMLAAFVFTLPWTTIGFWNALIGFLLMTFARESATTRASS